MLKITQKTKNSFPQQTTNFKLQTIIQTY